MSHEEFLYCSVLEAAYLIIARVRLWRKLLRKISLEELKYTEIGGDLITIKHDTYSCSTDVRALGCINYELISYNFFGSMIFFSFEKDTSNNDFVSVPEIIYPIREETEERDRKSMIHCGGGGFI